MHVRLVLGPRRDSGSRPWRRMVDWGEGPVIVILVGPVECVVHLLGLPQQLGGGDLSVEPKLPEVLAQFPFNVTLFVFLREFSRIKDSSFL